MSRPAIGFIGFGEAGFHLAKGLQGAGAEGLVAYDINTYTPKLGERIRRRGAESGVSLLDSSELLTTGSDILISTVVADAAVRAAEQTAPHLESRHIYADLNSVSPGAKQSIDSIVTVRGARFVEAAIMGPVPPKGHRVAILLGGVSAAELMEQLTPYGMNLEIVSERIGSASAVKMCRSIIVKGLEALMLESAMAASRYDVDARVFSSLSESFPGLDWCRLAGYMIGRVVRHGKRRAREMEEVAGMLDSIDIDPIMTEAAVRRQDWCGDLDLVFDGEPPEDYRELVEAIQNVVAGKERTPSNGE